ncbi:polysaccharide deacetylase family protein [Flavonifractor hominis]|uniref:Polysaccharide deacetylase family protein n=1 Tax=Flavonifractor hominis TaxID=3133178 RepID=A0ABV1ERP9_9FIRM
MKQIFRRRAALWPALLFFVALAGCGPARTVDAVVELPEEPKLVALTFDDGPRRATTTRLLDGLAQRGVHATFFLIGSQVEYQQDVVQRMDREGHQIGIHTFDHVELTELNHADFSAQVDTTRALLKQTLGHNDFLLRPPYGLLDESVKQWAGCPIILWSVDPEDWKDRDADRVVQAVVSACRDGSIILMHDIYPESVDAALEIVDQLHAQGYLFCTVDELFAARSLPLEAGQVYSNAYP